MLKSQRKNGRPMTFGNGFLLGCAFASILWLAGIRIAARVHRRRMEDIEQFKG